MNFNELETQILSFPGGYTCGVGAKLSEIEHAEIIINLKILGDYKIFLFKFGWLDIASMELFGLGVDVPPYLDLSAITISERTEMNPRLNKVLIPVFNDGGGNLYCINTSVFISGENPIVFWDHEGGSSQIPNVISDSFAIWLSEEIKQRV